MAQRNTPSQRRSSQIAQGYRNAHEIVSACMGLAALTGGGFWLDRKWGCLPVLTLVGATLGFVTAGVSLRRLLQRLDRESQRSKERPFVSREKTERWPQHQDRESDNQSSG